MSERVIALCISALVGSSTWALMPVAAHATTQPFCEVVSITTPNFTPVGECLDGYDATPYNCQTGFISRPPTVEGYVETCVPD